MTAGAALYTPQSDNLPAFVATTGVRIDPVLRVGLTLPPGTYYIPLGTSEGPICAESWIASVHFKWNAALAATITVESSNFPATTGGNGAGPADVADYDATAGNWIQENPASPTQYNISGASNTVSNTTFVAGGAAAGAVILYLANAAARRYRLKLVVTATGVFRAGAIGKD